MDTNKMREQFESTWADVMRGDEPAPGRKPTRSIIAPDRYAGSAAQFAWIWWQRSRSAVEIDMPETPNRGIGYGLFEAGKDACREAIEAQGLRVKP